MTKFLIEVASRRRAYSGSSLCWGLARSLGPLHLGRTSGQEHVVNEFSLLHGGHEAGRKTGSVSGQGTGAETVSIVTFFP